MGGVARGVGRVPVAGGVGHPLVSHDPHLTYLQRDLVAWIDVDIKEGLAP